MFNFCHDFDFHAVKLFFEYGREAHGKCGEIVAMGRYGDVILHAPTLGFACRAVIDDSNEYLIIGNGRYVR